MTAGDGHSDKRRHGGKLPIVTAFAASAASALIAFIASSRWAAAFRRMSFSHRLWAITGLALLIKLASLGLMTGRLQAYGLTPWDSLSYASPAMTLARSFDFHSEVRTPGYPAFLALIYLLTGDPDPASALNLVAVFLAQSALVSLGCLPIASAIRRLSGSEPAALWGALLWAINNSARFYSTLILTEAMSAFGMCLLAYALARLVTEQTPAWMGVTGLILLALAYLRPSISLLAIPVFLGIAPAVLHRYSVRRKSVSSLAVLIGLTLLLPLSAQPLWAARNAWVEGKRYYCRLSTFGVYTYGAAIPVALSRGDARPIEQILKPYWDEFFRLLPKTTPDELDRLYRDRTVDLAERYPLPIAVHLAKGAVFLFMPTVNKPNGFRYRDTMKPDFWLGLPSRQRLLYGAYMAGSLIEFLVILLVMGLLLGRFLTIRRSPSSASRNFVLTTLWILLYWIPVHAMVARWAGAARFLVPVVPILLVAAMAPLRSNDAKPVLPVEEGA